jgi:SAM-dependent methyltransferase
MGFFKKLVSRKKGKGLMSMLRNQMEKIYKDMPPEDIPWNMETVPDILKNIVKTGKIKPCKVIDLGCGTGNYVIYLSSEGFDATGVDFSETAIELARNSPLKSGVICKFISADVLGEMTEVKETFDFAYDWELLHHIFPQDREKYANNVYGLLNSGGKYLSVCFSEKSPQFGGEGKYRTTPLNTVLYFSSEDEIMSLFKPLFEIEEIDTVEIAGKFAPHQAIYTFMTRK